MQTAAPRVNHLEPILIRHPLVVSWDMPLAQVMILMSQARSQPIWEKPQSGAIHEALLADARASCVLVVEQGQLVGIFTERDVARVVAERISWASTPIGTVMSSSVVSLPESELRDSAIVLALFQTYRIRHLPITDAAGQVVGLLTYETTLLQHSNHKLEQQVQERTLKLQVQAGQEKLLRSIATRIRASLDLMVILETTVAEVRQFLGCDRVLIYQFQADGKGLVVAESVGEEWTASLHNQIDDPCFLRQNLDCGSLGYRRAVGNIHTAGYQPCYIEMLDRYQVKANLVVSLLVEGEIWGLLVGHQCSSYRHWQETDLELLDQLAIQVAIAIQQSNAYDQLQTELTERKRAEAALQSLNQHLEATVAARTAALQASEAQYRRIVETAGEGIWVLDPCDRTTFVNQRLAEMLGTTPEFMLGKTIYDFMDEEGKDIARHLLTRRHQGIHEQHDFKFKRLNHADDLWAIVATTPIVDAQGEFLGVLAMITDITARKQAELQLQQSNLELSRATRLKDEFLANMSHELRTPLNAILGMSESLLEKIHGDLTDRQKHQVETIERSGQHLLALINDILDLAKIEAGKLTLNCDRISIKKLCQSSLAFVKQTALEKNIQLNTTIAPNLHEAIADELRLRQLLLNLLSNAVKFTPANGSVSLNVTLETPPSVPGQPQQAWLSFSVIDTGIGIRDRDLHKLFQSFVQIDSQLNRQYSGTGLGLALVKRIAQLHQGEVSVQSVVDQGSTFTVRIPYQVPAAPPAKSVVTTLDKLNQRLVLPVACPTAPPLLLLLTEDHAAHTQTLSEYLTQRGYRLLITHNQQDAIALSGHHRPQLILMDMTLPDIDGLALTQEIHSDPSLAQIPVIALTATPVSCDRDPYLAAGIQHTLTKPIRLRQLADFIQQALHSA